MTVLLKLLIIASVVGILRSSGRFRNMSREFDEAALTSLRRIFSATEEAGYPAETILLLIAFTAVILTVTMAATGAFGQ